jgi:hypothetical protein
MFEMVMSRVLAIACGHEYVLDLDRLRHDPLMKVAVGRCPNLRYFESPSIPAAAGFPTHFFFGGEHRMLPLAGG